MRKFQECEELVRGLRALELFARLAPVSIEAFAKAGCFALAEATALIETFEIGGYAKRLRSDELYDLQPIAAELLLGQRCVCSAKVTMH